LGPARLVCRDAQYTDLSDMLRVTCESGDDKGGMDARSGPLFNNVDLIALEFLASFDDLYAGIFLQISDSSQLLGICKIWQTHLKAIGSVRTRR